MNNTPGTKKIFIFLICILLLTVLFSTSLIASGKQLHTAINFKLKDLNHRELSLKDFRGKIVILLLGELYQQNTLKAIQDLNKIVSGKRLFRKSVEILIIISEQNKSDKYINIMKDLNLSYPVLIDSNRNAYAQFEVKAIPTTIIFNKKGEIAARIPSYTIVFYDQVEAQLSYLLGKINLNELQNVMNSKNVTAEIDEKLERTLSLANNLYRRGFYDSAMDYYEEILTMSPDLIDGHLGRGNIFLKRNKMDMAKSEFQTVLKLNPDNPAALKGMAQINLFKGNISTAEKLLNKVISANYIDDDLYYILGQVYEKQGKLQEALNAYKKNCENLLRKKRIK